MGFTINRYFYSETSRNIKIPMFIDGQKVDRIGESAFNQYFDLEHIDIPNSVTVIETGAFYTCFSLKDIKLPEDLEELGRGVFEGCPLLKIVVPRKVKRLEDQLFRACQHLKIIVIPDAITSIGYQTFHDYTPEKIYIYHHEDGFDAEHLENGKYYQYQDTSSSLARMLRKQLSPNCEVIRLILQHK